MDHYFHRFRQGQSWHQQPPEIKQRKMMRWSFYAWSIMLCFLCMRKAPAQGSTSGRTAKTVEGTPFNYCSFDPKYESSPQEKKFLGGLFRKFMKNCVSVLMSATAEISRQVSVFDKIIQMSCFVNKICHSQFDRPQATGRARYQMSVQESEDFIECIVTIARRVDISTTMQVLNITEQQAESFNIEDMVNEILGCYAKHVSLIPGSVDSTSKLLLGLQKKVRP